METGSWIQDRVAEQVAAIRALIAAPHKMSQYIHYKGSPSIVKFQRSKLDSKNPPRFDGEFKLPVNSWLEPIAVPIIPYNDVDYCCLLDAIQNNLTYGACRNYAVTALGGGGAVGVPYLVETEDGATLVAKLSRISDFYARFLTTAHTSISGY